MKKQKFTGAHSNEEGTSTEARPRLADIPKFIPILYSTLMVQAILDNRKMQTRRLNGLSDINKNPNDWELIFSDGKLLRKTKGAIPMWVPAGIKCPYGSVNDVLWVRETFEYFESTYNPHDGIYDKSSSVRIQYKADRTISNEISVNKLKAINALYEIEIGKESGKVKFHPSIFMPKEAARLFLKVTSVRVERVNEISSKDAVCEGLLQNKFIDEIVKFNCYECDKEGHAAGKDLCDDGSFFQATDSFKSLWKSINGKDSWELNPWVWVIDFERIECPTVCL